MFVAELRGKAWTLSSGVRLDRPDNPLGMPDVLIATRSIAAKTRCRQADISKFQGSRWHDRLVSATRCGRPQLWREQRPFRSGESMVAELRLNPRRARPHNLRALPDG